jgi:hypothetical protein
MFLINCPREAQAENFPNFNKSHTSFMEQRECITWSSRHALVNHMGALSVHYPDLSGEAVDTCSLKCPIPLLLL